jgi:hypothetical protein
MVLIFLETKSFSSRRDELFGNDEGYRNLQNELMQNPHKGDVIPGVGSGVRKVRFSETNRGKGKSGGGRAIYIYIEEISFIAFLLLYDKDQATDLSASEKRHLSDAAKALRQELIAMFGKTKCE